jgi:hypothetical protein
MTALEKAERDLNNLEEQREALFHRAHGLAKQREAVAFAALAPPDTLDDKQADKQAKDKQTKAAAQLAEINREDISIYANIASVDAALTVARANLATAKAHEAGAADREQALALRELVKEWRGRAADVDAAFADIHAGLTGMQDTLDRMYQCGTSFPTHQQFKVLGLQALQTSLMGTPIWSKEFRFLGKAERRSFKDLIGGWADTIERQIAARLGDKEAA